MKLPKTRTENLLEQSLKDEMLIYDLANNRAFNLNKTSAIVYEACGQNLTFDELKRNHKFTEDLIYLALDELKRNNLLADKSYVSPFSGINRREVIKKVGFASMIALPIVTGLIAPHAVNALSSCPPPFSTGIPNGCQSGGDVFDPGSCAAQSDPSRSSTCNSFSTIAGRCASGRVEYAGDCRDNDENTSSSYTCICAA